MSGGHFEYRQYTISDIADTIQSHIDRSGTKIKDEDREAWETDTHYPELPDDIKDEFKQAVKTLKRAFVYAHRIDWFLSGDDGEETFIERLFVDLNKL